MSNLFIAKPLTLPCGVTLKNRLCKAAMTEGLADPTGTATPLHNSLYSHWANGGSGLLLTGNVQVDKRYLERPGNVVIDGPQSEHQLQALREFATSATANGTHAWTQLSHAGRQTPKIIASRPVGPSAVAVALPGGQFGKPRPLEQEEIEDIIQRFAHAAAVSKQVGFTGVQVHSAHGYLLSEFLNPRVNLRTDQWGGSLENRARLLLCVVRAVREAVGADFPVCVKLNSSDFQKGGYTFEDCQQVVTWLEEEGIDLLEISGGSYEQPRMMKLHGLEPVTESGVSERTVAREAYFLHYAKTIAQTVKTPLMVTGGFRSLSAMESALEEGSANAIGLGRPLCVDPDAPEQLLNGNVKTLEKWEDTLALGRGWLGPSSKIDLIKALNGFSSMAFYYRNIDLIAANKPVERSMNMLTAFIKLQLSERKKAAAIKRA
ncbi:MAG: NADH:flavin oxidoreductase/NADH oxidase family protein [Gammaproteobacteria bacterium]